MDDLIEEKVRFNFTIYGKPFKKCTVRNKEEISLHKHFYSVYCTYSCQLALKPLLVLVDLNHSPSIFKKCSILTPDIRKHPQTSLESI